jgi:hypothetical protein
MDNDIEDIALTIKTQVRTVENPPHKADIPSGSGGTLYTPKSYPIKCRSK